VLKASSSTPLKRPMPSEIYPMLATPIVEPFDGPDWLFEIKWDGYRRLLSWKTAKCAWSREIRTNLLSAIPS